MKTVPHPFRKTTKAKDNRSFGTQSILRILGVVGDGKIKKNGEVIFGMTDPPVQGPIEGLPASSRLIGGTSVPKDQLSLA